MTDITMWQDKAIRQAFTARGQEAFERIKHELEGQGGIIAIEPKSGDYFVGETLGQANNAAFQRYPDQWLYFVRLDNPEASLPLPTW